MLIGQSVHDSKPDAVALQAFASSANGVNSLLNRLQGNESNGPSTTALAVQNSHEVGVGHRREGMVTHVRLGEELTRDEQMSSIDRASVIGKGGTNNSEI
jgi:hypothetical protein